MFSLITKNSTLTELTWLDLDNLYRLLSHPQVMLFSKSGPESRLYAKKILKKQLHSYQETGFGLWKLTCPHSQAFQGICGLISQWIDGVPEVELSYRLLPEWWGQGIGTRMAGEVKQFAFDRLNLYRLISIIEPDNIASIRVAEKNKMAHEKTIMHHYKPAYLYSVYRLSDHYQ